jgi:hypothetical protein
VDQLLTHALQQTATYVTIVLRLSSGQPELGRRDDPDAAARICSSGFTGCGRNLKPSAMTSLLRPKRQEILDDQGETLAPEPMKGFKYDLRATGHPI